MSTAARRAPPPAAIRPSDSLGWPDGPRGTLAALGSPFCFSRESLACPTPERTRRDQIFTVHEKRERKKKDRKKKKNNKTKKKEGRKEKEKKKERRGKRSFISLFDRVNLVDLEHASRSVSILISYTIVPPSRRYHIPINLTSYSSSRYQLRSLLVYRVPTLWHHRHSSSISCRFNSLSLDPCINNLDSDLF